MINKIPGTRPDQRSKVWTVIHKLYENVMSFVRINSDGVEEDSSDYEVRQGLREGSCLSPTLFAIFINDIISKLEEADVEGMSNASSRVLIFGESSMLMTLLS